MQPRVSDLVEAICKALPGAPARLPGRIHPEPWPRPPLRTDLVLGDIKLADYNPAKLPLNFSKMRAVFEMFVASALVSDEPFHVQDFMQESLEIDSRVAQWLFPKDVEDPLHHLTTLMWITHSSTGCEFGIGNGDCWASDDGVTIGVRNNELLSKFNEGTLADFDYEKSLAEHHVRGAAVENSSGLMESILEQAKRIKTHGTREGVLYGLGYLYYRYGNRWRVANWLHNGKTPRRPRGKGLRATLQELSSTLKQYNNPMPNIHRRLVGAGVLKEHVFNRAFGDYLHLVYESEEFDIEYEQYRHIYEILKNKKKEFK